MYDYLNKQINMYVCMERCVAEHSSTPNSNMYFDILNDVMVS